MKEHPLAGSKIGQEIMASVCKECWDEWERVELMIVNENRLTPHLKEHREIILREMRGFLNLPRKA
jgi:Fe-S cluster biosynthesis and repair protein YggX